MASFSIGTHNLHITNRFKKQSFHSLSSTPLSSLLYKSCFGSSLCKLRGSRALGNGLGARAEYKAKGSSSSPPPSSPSNEQQGQQLNIDKQLQELEQTSGSCDPLCSVDETSSQDFEANYQPKTDLVKALAIFAAAGTGAVAINHSWVAANQDLAMALLFGIGYAGIIFEESLAFNKSGVGLLMAVSLWVIRSIGAPSPDIAVSELTHASAEVSEIVFFLLGAMTIVEIVDAHQGFKLVTDNITTRKPRTLLWVVGFVTFFLSSVLDNLTSTIVMVSLLRKLVPPSEYRKLLGAVVVIAANAGGAWTPIGDVTTTMLWIHGQISTLPTMKGLLVPSVISLAVPLSLLSLTSEVNGKGQDLPNVMASEQMAPRGQLVFSVGIGALIFVPVFKALTGLPPFMGMLLGLGVLWILTDAIHYGESERQRLKVPQALSRIDTQGALFFLGILLSVSSLEAAGLLRELANYLDAHIPNIELIASAIGVGSAIIDNVPLVAATMGMYDLSSFPQDHEFWQLVAFCAGTGGSMLVIGSAAGVALMGMEILGRFGMLESNEVTSPVVPGFKVSKDLDGTPVDDMRFKQLVGSLIYLTATRPDIMFATSLVSRYMARPTELHLQAAKRILRYLRGTTNYGIHYKRGNDGDLLAFTDSDYAGDMEDRKSTSGYVFLLSSGAISWGSKKQPIVTLSSTEAEFVAATVCACQAIWMKRVLKELGHSDEKCILIHCDNSSTIKLSKNPVLHGRSKHIDVRYHFLRNLSNAGSIALIKCGSEEQTADIMTKPLKAEAFHKLRRALGVCDAADIS